MNCGKSTIAGQNLPRKSVKTLCESLNESLKEAELGEQEKKGEVEILGLEQIFVILQVDY